MILRSFEYTILLIGKLIALLFLLIVAYFVCAFLYDRFWPRHAYVGIMVPLEDMQERSTNWEIAELGKRGGEFKGPTTLLMGDNQIELPDAWITFISDAGYPTSVNVLERKGHYTREQAIDQWLKYVEMARALPDWYEERNTLDGHVPFKPWNMEQSSQSGISPDKTERENAEAIMNFIGPDLPMGTRKVPLLAGRFKMSVKGRNFFSILDINMTYDTGRPKTPYRFAFHLGLHANSMDCFRGFRTFYEEQAEGVDYSYYAPSNNGIPPYDPEWKTVFEGWDRSDTTLKTMRPYLDNYIFKLCDKNAQTWHALGITRSQ